MHHAVSPINESMKTKHVWIIDSIFTSDRSSDCGSVDDSTDAVTVTLRPLVFIFCMHDVIDTIRFINTQYTAQNSICATDRTAYFIVRHKSLNKWNEVNWQIIIILLNYIWIHKKKPFIKCIHCHYELFHWKVDH